MTNDKKVREEIVKRWESLGFTEGLHGKSLENIVKLYESEAKQLVAESETKDYSEIEWPRIIRK